MKKVILIGIVLILFLTACKSTDRTKNNKIIDAYSEFINELEQKDIYYTYKDIDGDGSDELIVKENTEITVYTYKDAVSEIGKHDFFTGTARLLYSNNPQYPGIIYFTVGGGKNHYGYVSIKNDKLYFEDLWEENYSSIDGTDRIKEISDNKQLIEESKKSYNENKDIEFLYK